MTAPNNDPNSVWLPPGVTPLPLKDVDRSVAESVGFLMRRHHHSPASTCDWCLQVARHVLADTTNLIKSKAHRDDPVAAFIRRHRDDHTEQGPAGAAASIALDDLLDAYRLHADTGVPLTEPTPSPHPEDEERLHRPHQVVPGFGAADMAHVIELYDQEFFIHIGANIEDLYDNSDAGLNRSVQAHRHALIVAAAHAYRLAEQRRRNDAATALLNYRDLTHYPSRHMAGMCVCGEDIDEDAGFSTGCMHWQSLTDAIRDVRVGAAEIPPSVLVRAVDGYSRSGEIPDVNVFPDVLHDLGDKLVDEFRLFRVAFHSNQIRRLRYPVAVLDKALAVLSALTAALNHTRTPTAPEIVDRERTESATWAGDRLRLHLVSHHWLPEALGMTDEGAHRLHGYLHAGRIGDRPAVPHDEDNVTFHEDTGIMVVSRIAAEEGGLTYRTWFRDQCARAAQPPPTEPGAEPATEPAPEATGDG